MMVAIRHVFMMLLHALWHSTRGHDVVVHQSLRHMFIIVSAYTWHCVHDMLMRVLEAGFFVACIIFCGSHTQPFCMSTTSCSFKTVMSCPLRPLCYAFCVKSSTFPSVGVNVSCPRRSHGLDGVSILNPVLLKSPKKNWTKFVSTWRNSLQLAVHLVSSLKSSSVLLCG